MSIPNVATRQANSKTEYKCMIDGWVVPKVINVTGFSDLVCPHCDATLHDDHLDRADDESVDDFAL